MVVRGDVVGCALISLLVVVLVRRRAAAADRSKPLRGAGPPVGDAAGGGPGPVAGSIVHTHPGGAAARGGAARVVVA